MPSTRAVISVVSNESYTTYLFSERAFQSAWSHPDVPVLVFADSALPGFSVQHHGGPVGSGLPVELLFWGDWWNSPAGVARRVLIETRTQAVLASDYFSELKQYGVERPHWRGAKIVTKPGPPGAFNSNDDQQAVPDLIDELIDDDVFPDPDDEKIAFVVFMPQGFTESINANGAHTKDYDYTFPWDVDWFWVAWVRSFGDVLGEDPEDAIRTMTHELVEMFSDPESDAWYAGEPQTGEIADAAVSGSTKQTAWVNGAHVSAYWSNQYGATVIPIDRDYKARILGTIRLEHREVVNGTFSPDPSDSKLCALLPQCCMEERDYKFSVVKRDETVRLTVETERYRQPQLAWAVDGKPVNANGVVSVDVIAGTFEGRRARFGPKSVAIQCSLSNNELTLRTVGTESNFDVPVTCSITDASITGNVRTNVIARPSVSVGFVGAELTVDPDYERQRAECEKAAAKLFKDLGKSQPKGKVKIGDPVEFDPGVLGYVPAYAGLQQYARARRIIDLARMAHAALPTEAATALTATLFADTPVLQAARAAQLALRIDATTNGHTDGVASAPLRSISTGDRSADAATP